jgi:RNA polymerase sigma-70 factor (ECF subfamily)
MKVGNQHDAEDVAQETVISMYRFIGKLKSPEAVDVWVNSIVRSRCMDLLRKQAPQRQELDIDDELIDIPEDDDRDFLPEAFAEDEALRSQLMEAVMQLPDKAREVITLYYYEGLSYKEIAKVTGTKMATVSTNLIHARNTLKKKLMASDKDMGPASSAGTKGDAYSAPASDSTLASDSVPALDAGPTGSISSKFAGVAATSTVMGRALHAEALTVLPDAKIALLEEKVIGAVHAQPVPKHVSKTVSTAKGAIAIAAGAAIVLGSVFFAGGFNEIPIDSEPVAVVAPVTPVVPDTPAVAQEIIFTDGDCECGHINPKGFDVTGIPEGASDIFFSVFAEGDETALISDVNEVEVSSELAKLSSEKQDGSYLLVCTYKNINGKEVRLKRVFVVGNYAGDSETGVAAKTVSVE